MKYRRVSPIKKRTAGDCFLPPNAVLFLLFCLIKTSSKQLSALFYEVFPYLYSLFCHIDMLNRSYTAILIEKDARTAYDTICLVIPQRIQ